MRYFASYVAPDLPKMGRRHYPDWIFLARRAFISDRHNSTVAHGHTSDGNPVQVSLFAADPPAVSHLRVHCPGREDEFSDNPAVIFSRDDLILFNVTFDHGVSDHFMYRADSKNTSLVRVENPEPDTTCSGMLNTGIVRCGDDHFTVAALSQDYMTGRFNLSVFSSRTGVWTTTEAPLEPSELLCGPEALALACFLPDKVIPLKGSILGWVNLWKGILLCDVLSDEPKLHYIPLPEPMPANEGLEDQGEPQFFRDVIGCGELIKFVEVDYQYDGPAPTNTNVYSPDDKWTAVIRSRDLDSGEWGRAHEVSSEDITVSENFHEWSDLLPDELCEDGKPSLKKMPIGVPTLCECNNDLFLMCKLKRKDNDSWVLAVDTESKKLKTVAKYYAVSLPGFSSTYYPSSFSKYLEGRRTGCV